MYVRISIEISPVPFDVKSTPHNSSQTSDAFAQSDALKIAFNAALDEVEGFQNWQDSRIAEEMLDDPQSVFESLEIEKRYLLEGYYDGDFFHILIEWEQGKQPRVLRMEREKLRRRVK